MGKHDSEQTAQTPTPERVLDEQKERAYQIQFIRSFLIKLLVVVAAVFLTFRFIFGLGAVSGEDMYPRVRDGDLLFYYRLDHGYVADELTTYRRDGQRYVGRVVAVAGDTVDLSEEGELIINGALQQEQIFYATYKDDASSVVFPLEIGEGEVFVLGDFRTGATDSRTFGALPVNSLDGKVLALLRRRGL